MIENSGIHTILTVKGQANSMELAHCDLKPKYIGISQYHTVHISYNLLFTNGFINKEKLTYISKKSFAQLLV